MSFIINRKFLEENQFSLDHVAPVVCYNKYYSKLKDNLSYPLLIAIILSAPSASRLNPYFSRVTSIKWIDIKSFLSNPHLYLDVILHLRSILVHKLVCETALFIPCQSLSWLLGKKKSELAPLEKHQKEPFSVTLSGWLSLLCLIGALNYKMGNYKVPLPLNRETLFSHLSLNKTMIITQVALFLLQKKQWDPLYLMRSGKDIIGSMLAKKWDVALVKASSWNYSLLAKWIINRYHPQINTSPNKLDVMKIMMMERKSLSTAAVDKIILSKQETYDISAWFVKIGFFDGLKLAIDRQIVHLDRRLWHFLKDQNKLDWAVSLLDSKRTIDPLLDEAIKEKDQELFNFLVTQEKIVPFSLENKNSLSLKLIQTNKKELLFFSLEKGVFNITLPLIQHLAENNKSRWLKELMKDQSQLKGYFLESIKEKDLIACKALLEIGADPNQKNLMQEPILFDLIESNDPQDQELCWLILRNARCDVNTKDTDGNTLLMMAVYHNKKDIVQMLLTKPKIDVNAQNDEKVTALMLAVEEDAFEISRQLLKHKNIDVNLKNSDGKSAFLIAHENDSTGCVLAILDSQKLNSEARESIVLDEVAMTGSTLAIKLWLEEDELEEDELEP
ncbi:MAG: ankyrin repeat domain-containing protein [Rhabdochlamydiaceae bacterium]